MVASHQPQRGFKLVNLSTEYAMGISPKASIAYSVDKLVYISVPCSPCTQQYTSQGIAATKILLLESKVCLLLLLSARSGVGDDAVDGKTHLTLLGSS